MKILQMIVDGLVCKGGSQSDFVPERGTTDAIFVVPQMQKKCIAVNNYIYTAFLTLEKAFNCVPRIFMFGAEKAMFPSE